MTRPTITLTVEVGDHRIVRIVGVELSSLLCIPRMYTFRVKKETLVFTEKGGLLRQDVTPPLLEGAG